MAEHTVNINGIDVEARYSDRTVETVLVPLLKRLALLWAIQSLKSTANIFRATKK